MDQRGYSLIELVIVMGIMAVLFTLGFAGYSQFNARQELVSLVNQVKTDIRSTQNRALSGVSYENERAAWVFQFHTNTVANNNYSIQACNGLSTNPTLSKFTATERGCFEDDFPDELTAPELADCGSAGNNIKVVQLAPKFHIYTSDSGWTGEPDVNMNFSAITGDVKLHDNDYKPCTPGGNPILGYTPDPRATSVRIFIRSDSYAQACYVLNVNKDGNITEEERTSCP